MSKKEVLKHQKIDWKEKDGLYVSDLFHVDLIKFVSNGKIGELKDFVYGKNGEHDEGEIEKNKKILREIRFWEKDSWAAYYGDKTYDDCFGWCLLNAAASAGKPEMVEFLVKEVGMDINQVRFGSTSIFCCFPSIHDEPDSQKNCSKERLEAAQKFLELGCDATKKTPLFETSIIHTAAKIQNDELRQKALEILLEKNIEACKQKDFLGRNVFFYLLMNRNNLEYKNLRPQLELLLMAGVEPEKSLQGQDPSFFIESKQEKEDFQNLINDCEVKRKATQAMHVKATKVSPLAKGGSCVIM